jgi:hypothetical protein
MNIVKTNAKAALFEVSQTPEAQTLTVYVNPKQIQKAESIINKFQLSDFNGPVLKKGWTAKQVQGAINPGDIVKQDADKARGMWYFYRLAKVDTKVKSMEEDILREADEIVAAYAEKKTIKEVTGPMDRPLNVGDTIDMGKVDPTTVMISKTYSNLLDYHRSLVSTITKTHPEVAKDINTVLKDLKKYLDTQSKINEEMHGGYLELLEMNPNFEEGVAKLLQAWNEWAEGDMTEPYMIEEAKHDILAYLSSMMK